MNNSTYKDIIREFNKLYPNISVEMTSQLLELVKYSYRVGYGEGFEDGGGCSDED